MHGCAYARLLYACIWHIPQMVSKHSLAIILPVYLLKSRQFAVMVMLLKPVHPAVVITASQVLVQDSWQLTSCFVAVIVSCLSCHWVNDLPVRSSLQDLYGHCCIHNVFDNVHSWVQ